MHLHGQQSVKQQTVVLVDTDADGQPAKSGADKGDRRPANCYGSFGHLSENLFHRSPLKQFHDRLNRAYCLGVVDLEEGDMEAGDLEGG